MRTTPPQLLLQPPYQAGAPVGRYGLARVSSLERFDLEASYEATVCAATLNATRTKNNTLFLTLLGGGAFGNDEVWITDAMRHALSQHGDSALDVAIVSYGRSQPCVQELVGEFSGG